VTDDLNAPALWEVIAERLRQSILNGQIQAGDRLIEMELAEEFGTSRGPVREAFQELAREGLIVDLPRRGAVVSTLTGHDLSEVYAVREALDSAASRIVIRAASNDDIAGLEVHLDALDAAPPAGGSYLDLAIHDLAFHRALVALAGNRRMTTISEQMLTQTMLLLRTAARYNPTLRSTMRPEAHRDILAALLARDEPAARAAVEAHYRYAEERLFPSQS
jgi:DNA-binding GntR family transcriptional regulator